MYIRYHDDIRQIYAHYKISHTYTLVRSDSTSDSDSYSDSDSDSDSADRTFAERRRSDAPISRTD